MDDRCRYLDTAKGHTLIQDHSRQYRKYIAGPVWKRRAAQKKATHGPYCDGCYVRKKLDVHHLDYERAFFGQEPDEDLAPVFQQWTLRNPARRHLGSDPRRTQTQEAGKGSTGKGETLAPSLKKTANALTPPANASQ